ncbi:tRNA(Ile)-lysidine synthase TilS/MesJ [Eubacterium aggregans]|uniref:tRNA(Ile)-lysidine synthase TilS/MesJ n=1 Tax=Eubacterium aggregans TaxID=81409 RepID=A0A1H3ZB04_9FIRM|nr:ATP-binding protein [Eubacterium aggregans]SEA20953.1 tRNA(Ile)-lysidine synthase TilS/MesJ [Eubacterium aggregans]
MTNNNETTITLGELDKLSSEEYILIDIRDEAAYTLGHIPGAIRMDEGELLAEGCALPLDKLIIPYCIQGLLSEATVDALVDRGYRAANLMGGYREWLLGAIQKDLKKTDRNQTIEKSLQKKYHKKLLGRFTKAVVEYALIEPGDKIAVCISGGKDSMLMAKLFQELKRHNKIPFELVFLVMDPGYSPVNRQVIEGNARLMGIPIEIFDSQIFDAVVNIEKSPCYLCARMRRGHLYNAAKERGCNKIALGHHFDDVIETILMGMLYGGQVQTMMPKLHSTNFEGMELIRPLYLVREDDIKAWRDDNDLHFIQCACHFTHTCSLEGKSMGDGGSKRVEIKHLIAELKKTNPHVENNIFKSVENVCLDAVIGYKQGGVRHRFLEGYDGK